MKKILSLMALFCAVAVTTAVITACGDDDTTYKKSYAYEVDWEILSSVAYQDQEAEAILQQLNYAVGNTNGGNYTSLASSPSDDKMINECKAVAARYANIKSVYLVYHLYRLTFNADPNAQNEKTLIETFEFGLACTSSIVTYDYSSTYDAAYSELKNKKEQLDSASYYGSVKTLLALKNAFANEFKSINKYVYYESNSKDLEVANACDSIMKAHESDPLAVSISYETRKINVRTKVNAKVWEGTLQPNIR